MKVIYKSDVTKPVGDVKHGQCFMRNGSIFMKAYHDFDYAVDIEDGIIYKLVDMDEQVISVEAEVVVINSSGDGVAGTLDSSYFKGQGERQGIEREYIVTRNHGE